MIYRSLCILLLITFGTKGLAQSFTIETLPRLNTGKTAFAVIAGDFNGDYLDDLVRIGVDQTALPSSHVTLWLQQSNGGFRLVWEDFIVPSVWSAVATDLDNNGQIDIVLGLGGATPRVYLQQSDGTWREDAVGFDRFFAQSMNVIDIDADGWSDLFICDDNAASYLYKNSDGVLDRSNWIDQATTPPSDNSGNYGSIWLDIDQDDDLDLVVAKCRAGVTDPDDPRRINMAFRRDGDTFTNVATEIGLDDGSQSWSITAGDVNNDGKEDLLVTNHYSPSVIMLQDNNGFSKVLPDAIDTNAFYFQGLLYDLNLDGYMDIILGASDFVDILWQVDDLEFRKDRYTISGSSLAIGDFNHDGLPDLFAGGGSEDQILYQEPNLYHFIEIGLEHPLYNEGIGAKIEVYTEGQMYMRRITAGESYGIQSSISNIIGIGEATSVDSVVVTYPDLSTMVYKDLNIDTKYRLTAGGCAEPILSFFLDTLLCPVDSLVLDIPDFYETAVWSDGDSSFTRVLKTPVANLTGKLLKPDGCYDRIAAFTLNQLNSIEPLFHKDEAIICDGKPLVIDHPLYDSIWINDEAYVLPASITMEASYDLKSNDVCGQSWENRLYVYEVESWPNPAIDVDVEVGTSYRLQASEELQLVVRDTTGEIVSVGGEFRIDTMPNKKLNFLYNFQLAYKGIDELLGLIEPSRSFSQVTFNSGIHFEVFDEVFIETVDVFSSKAGLRKILLLSSSGQVIFENLIDLPEGYGVIGLGLVLPKGNYTLTTDTQQNLASFGTEGPLFSRTLNAGFPYTSKYMALTGTMNGRDNYYYFYAWKIYGTLGSCPGEPAPLILNPRPVSTYDQVAEDDLEVYPNPSSDIFYWDNPEWRPSILSDVVGQSYTLDDVTESSLSMKSLPSGIYYLSFIRDGNHLWKRLLKK